MPEPDPLPAVAPESPAAQPDPATESDIGMDDEGSAPVVEHDPTGLDLARSVARSVGTQARRRRTKPRTAVEPQSSSARPDDRDPQLLAAAMDRLVETKGWSTDINVHTLLGRWPLLVGTPNAEHSHPEGYQEGVLTVRADSTVWAASIRAMAPQLVAILNDRLGDGTVRRVNVLGPDGPSWKRGRLSVRDGRGPRDTYG